RHSEPESDLQDKYACDPVERVHERGRELRILEEGRVVVDADEVRLADAGRVGETRPDGVDRRVEEKDPDETDHRGEIEVRGQPAELHALIQAPRGTGRGR